MVPKDENIETRVNVPRLKGSRATASLLYLTAVNAVLAASVSVGSNSPEVPPQKYFPEYHRPLTDYEIVIMQKTETARREIEGTKKNVNGL